MNDEYNKQDKEDSEDLAHEYYNMQHDEEQTYYSSKVKVEPASRLAQSLLIHFVELLMITKEDDHYAGAILVVLELHDGSEVEQWLPKKLCSNLDYNYNTVCVWDKFMNDRIKELGGLSYEPEYAGESN